MLHPRLTVVTLGARDLPRLRDFYAGLGWELAVDMDDFAAFQTGGAVLTLYAAENLAADAALEPVPLEPGRCGLSLAVNVDAIEQVDEGIEAARAAAARVVREPRTMDWGGRAGYFADPEENVWEVAWVPQDTVMAGLLRKAVGQADR
jgi:catechol 2,3-dioxygenase-like lactoylglutathione lyase family enzyme